MAGAARKSCSQYLIMSFVPLLPPQSAPASFPHIAEGQRQQLLALARRFLGCDHLAQDALQEALISLSQQPEVPAKPYGWLTLAVIHRCRHMRRSVRRRQSHEHRASKDCALHADCDNPLHIAMAHEIAGLLAAVRDSLPQAQRAALELYEVKGHDYSAIADTLNVPIGTVRSRLSRAREALRLAVKPLVRNEQSR
jgi:RNA polymerase sigma-70 factor (ECF subfamily)